MHAQKIWFIRHIFTIAYWWNIDDLTLVICLYSDLNYVWPHCFFSLSWSIVLGFIVLRQLLQFTVIVSFSLQHWVFICNESMVRTNKAHSEKNKSKRKYGLSKVSERCFWRRKKKLRFITIDFYRWQANFSSLQ